MVEWTLDKAENTVHAAVQASKPVAAALERPIRTVDGAVCSGLDYVESKVPAVKLPPQEVSRFNSSVYNWFLFTFTAASKAPHSQGQK